MRATYIYQIYYFYLIFCFLSCLTCALLCYVFFFSFLVCVNIYLPHYFFLAFVLFIYFIDLLFVSCYHSDMQLLGVSGRVSPDLVYFFIWCAIIWYLYQCLPRSGIFFLPYYVFICQIFSSSAILICKFCYLVSTIFFFCYACLFLWCLMLLLVPDSIVKRLQPTNLIRRAADIGWAGLVKNRFVWKRALTDQPAWIDVQANWTKRIRA